MTHLMGAWWYWILLVLIDSSKCIWCHCTAVLGKIVLIDINTLNVVFAPRFETTILVRSMNISTRCAVKHQCLSGVPALLAIHTSPRTTVNQQLCEWTQYKLYNLATITAYGVVETMLIRCLCSHTQVQSPILRKLLKSWVVPKKAVPRQHPWLTTA